MNCCCFKKVRSGCFAWLFAVLSLGHMRVACHPNKADMNFLSSSLSALGCLLDLFFRVF